MTGPGPGPDQPGWAAPPPPAWGPAPPPPPPFTQAPGAPRRRARWLLVLIPLLAVFTVGLGLAIVGGVELFRGPVDATNQYLAALRARDSRAAYARSCLYAEDAPSYEDFVADQQRDEVRFGPVRAYDITESTFDGSGAQTRGTVVRGSREYDVRFDLREYGDEWKVCSGVVRNP